MAKTRRREFRYDPASPEGRIIDAWLERHANINRAVCDLILEAASQPSGHASLLRLVRQAIREELAHLKLTPAPDDEDPVLAERIDTLFD